MTNRNLKILSYCIKTNKLNWLKLSHIINKHKGETTMPLRCTKPIPHPVKDLAYGNLLYLAPGIGILVLIYTKIAKVEDVVKNMTSDMVWMIAGVLVVADALGKSGAGNLIGQFILAILGENPSSIAVMLIFSAATVIMTTFLSNMATQTVLIPIAASVALAGGWDPRGIILAIGTANMLAIGFPSGSGEAAVCYAAGGYNPARVMKFTIPYTILGIISSAVAANLMFPIYG
ncbi:MAG: hypothetical protein E7249_02605 [Paenibacillaceae bacterium]|nr:hypothetical protein [Paenibacillaceae bacterium]